MADNKQELTPEQIQKAKEFIWEYLDEPNKKLAVLNATTSSLADNKLSVKEITVLYEYNRQ